MPVDPEHPVKDFAEELLPDFQTARLVVAEAQVLWEAMVVQFMVVVAATVV
jgi:hypothetical protein